MKTYIKYKRFFAYSEEYNKCFYTEFGNGINLIYGKNTSGKSTLIQSLNYTFGINDEKHKLDEVLAENVIFRLDFEFVKSNSENITIIRDTDFIFIHRKDHPTRKFFGINGNKSVEHKLLKKYLAELLGFNLFLESKGEYKLGSIESMFLPYYVAQDYGWVLSLKSFRGLDYFRNFKFDYYDYYLGIKNDFDRLEKQNLETKKQKLENERRFLVDIEKSNDNLLLSKLKDEEFITKTAEYIAKYKGYKEELIQGERDYLVLSNKIKLCEEHRKVLLSIKRNIKNQSPYKDNCPTCKQKLPNTIERVYEYFQDIEDTEKQLKTNKKEISDKKGNLNSLKKKNCELRTEIEKRYSVLKDYNIDNLSVNTWLENKANVTLSKKIQQQLGIIEIELQGVIGELNKFKTEELIIAERKKKEKSFYTLFSSYLKELEVKMIKDDYTLYANKLFPQQGVELLKTLLAYYFSLNKLFSSTSYVHRLPMVMDAIFKEDVDESNRALILDFINKFKPCDTQIIFSVAESKNNNKTAFDYNKEHFNSNCKLIEIDTKKERAFLSEFQAKYEEIKNETLELIE
ncbi:MAG: hypothetical protein N4A49_05425 [Marinifilaceae bacterium]|jgi:energy-coupling factor transporter ATP-binding protein EcfA2|nr:hypothetical protein [Marinifilaceae bacterium]